MNEPSEEVKAMARRIVAANITTENRDADEIARAKWEIEQGHWDDTPIVRSALAAIIETQRADAESISQKRERLLDLCAESGVTDIRAACDMALEAAEQTIRTGNHYTKDESPTSECDHDWRFTGSDYHGSHKGEDHYRCTKCGKGEYRHD